MDAGCQEVVNLNDMGKNLLLWLIIGAVLLVVFNMFNPGQRTMEVDYSEFLEWVTQERVRDIVIDGDGITIRGTLDDNTRFEPISRD